MKGRPFTGKSTIARQIGKAFPCPVIDHDDIRSSLAHLQLFVPPSISPQRDQQMYDLSFQDVCRVAQTQLQLFKIVVVDSSLSPRSRLDHLLELSNSNGAVLVILECKPIVQATRRKWWLEHERDYDVTRQSKYPYKPSTWDDVKDLSGKYSDYDDKDVRKLIADTTSEMVDWQLTFPLLELAKSEGICHLHVKQWTDQGFGNLSLDTQAVAEPRHSSRNHIIRFSVDKRIPENEEAHINCNKCLESISSSVEAYNCTHCNLYLHKSCAESHPIKKLELSPQDRLLLFFFRKHISAMLVGKKTKTSPTIVKDVSSRHISSVIYYLQFLTATKAMNIL
ncbi:cysteine/histidine-rich C1 domain family protein [Actinidia rufa]|uniref:Cysteine/histidine-rich C1 domain family protein n=1 Tax=Actinidia rufa TaxID=165716 RepID=A0A7J0DL74_9ERIC|nr:cysteine/histidine-rich C1 domain family protein [Actinidia rufa]